MLSSLKHKNLVSFVGFCDENDRKIIITRRETRGCLYRYLSDSMTLTWVRRLEISVGIAQALSYIHYNESRDFSLIYCNIDGTSIQLNDAWEPKLGDFIRFMKIKVSERHYSFHTHSDSVFDEKGHVDPTYEKTNSVNHKLDIYSFGTVLFELLCGRESVIDDHDNKYLAPVAIFHYREKTLDEIIDPDLLTQMDPRSRNIFSEIAYECLSEEQFQRPNMDKIVTRLEKALELQLKCENAEHSSFVAEGGETSSNHEKGSKSHFIPPVVESHLSKKTMSSLAYEDIKQATENFAPENIIKKKGEVSVFQGRMKHFGQYIDIVAWKISYHFFSDKEKYMMKVQMLSSLKHKNLASFIGVCQKCVGVCG